jgi:hypothetical protein
VHRLLDFADQNRLLVLVVWTALVVALYLAVREPGSGFFESELRACQAKCAPRAGHLETRREERAFQNSPRPAHKYPECKCS